MRSVSWDSSTIAPDAHKLASNNKTRRYRVTIIAPTCFYYQVEIFRQMANHPRIDLMVYFCSDESLKSQDVATMFNSSDEWGDRDTLLKGYRNQLLKNYSPTPSYLKWPTGLINLGIFGELRRTKPDAVILMAWSNPTWWISIITAFMFGSPVFYMTDANVQGEASKNKLKLWLKRVVLAGILFRVVTGFLSAGQSNRMLYRLYGVPDNKIIPFAYSWGYDKLADMVEEQDDVSPALRDKLGIKNDAKVVLFCGRLSEEKNLFNLLAAYHQLEVSDCALVLVGDGPLMERLKKYVSDHDMKSVHFLGFQNRDTVLKYYAIADVLVLPSIRETWGIVINEAMCFGLPVIASDQVGAVYDMLDHGINGYIFKVDEVDGLAHALNSFFSLPDEDRALMGTQSLKMIRDWSNRNLAESLVERLDDTSPRT